MITFGMITNGKRSQKLMESLESIYQIEGLPEYEIIIAGRPPQSVSIDRKIDMPEAADNGQLGAMRNAICERARGDILSIADDDMLYHADWYKGFLSYEGDWDAMATVMLNPDGTRNWDWVTKGGPRGHILLEYWEHDPFLYITGGRVIIKAAVFNDCQWDAERGFNREEDIDFTRKLQRANKKIVFNRAMLMLHNDSRYTSVGRHVYMVR